MNEDLILAVDIGGTKIAAGLVDSAGRLSGRQEQPTLAEEGREAILRRVEMLGAAVLGQAAPGRVRAVGIASAGQIEPQGRKVFYATDNLPGWKDLDLAGAVEAMFGLPSVADNDVNAMALAEHQMGAGRGIQDLLCVMVGTGIGGALIQNGRLYRGAYGGAGEFGHITIQAIGGRACNCGGQGCVEAYASSRALVWNAAQALAADGVDVLNGRPVKDLTIQDVAALFQAPEKPHWPGLSRMVGEAAEALGAGIASAANLLDPQLIVIAGSVMLFGEAYLERVQQSFGRRAMAPRRAARLCYSQLGPDPALIGAALLARERFLT